MFAQWDHVEIMFMSDYIHLVARVSCYCNLCWNSNFRATDQENIDILRDNTSWTINLQVQINAHKTSLSEESENYMFNYFS